jgi:adenylate kinase
VPDEIVNKAVKERLQNPDTEDVFVLEGYPRNMAQVETLSSFLEKEGKEHDYVLHVKVDNIKLVDRLRKRRLCSNCGAIYHLICHLEYIPLVIQTYC